MLSRLDVYQKRIRGNLESRDDDKWQMELTGTDKASLLWIELPKDLKAKPILLVKQRKSDPIAE